MSGRITFEPTRPTACESAAGCDGRPKPEEYRPGTIWTCDDCGQEWVVVTGAQYNEAYTAWRHLTEKNRGGRDV